MNTSVDKQALLGKIRDTIKNLIDEEITYHDARSLYLDLKNDADLIANGNDNSERKKNFLDNLFRSHNIANFCKLTVEFSVQSGELQIIHSSGSESLLHLIKDTIIREKHKVAERVFFLLPSFSLDGLDYRAFITKSPFRDEEKYLLSLTSSKYSRQEAFMNFATILYSFSSLANPSAASNEFGIYDKVRAETVKLLKQYIDAGVAVKSMLYRFDNIYEIFEHRGLKTLLDIDQRIVSSLQNYHGYEGTVTTLGPSTYLVLLPVEERVVDKEARPPARLLFEYEDVIFRYWVYRKIIHDEAEASSVFYWISETLKEAHV